MDETIDESPHTERGVPYDVSPLEQVKRNIQASVESRDDLRSASRADIVEFVILQLVSSKLIRPQALLTEDEVTSAMKRGFRSEDAA